MRLLLSLLFLLSCGTIKGLGGDFIDVTACEFTDCGTVFLCHLPLSPPQELCWIDDSATELETAIGRDASCEPTPRGGALGWPCFYACPSPAHGCDAYDGCFCP